MKKVLLFSLALVMALTVFMPAPALAAKPQTFNASGTVNFITKGDIKPAGDSGRFVVVEREIRGTFAGPDIVGPFSMTYKANVELATQAGNLHGTLQSGSKILNLNGKIQPLEMVPVPIPVGIDPAGNPIIVTVSLPKLTITGHWNFLNGAKGEGEFTAWAIFIPDPDGHVEQFIASSFTVTGQYQQ